MARLTYFVAVTADGFIAAPDGSINCFNLPGEHLAHIAAEYPETIPAHLRAMLGVEGGNRHFDAVLMGRSTYALGADAGFTNPYPHMRQILVSRTLDETPDPSVELVQHDVPEAVRAIKREAKLGVWLCGGGRLAASLADEIDALVLKVNPIAIGSGVPLFHGLDAPLPLELVAQRSFSGGVTFLHYVRRRTDL